LRILQISSAQSFGGGERHLADLAKGLVARGHEVYVALRSRSSLIAELKGVSRQNFITLPLRNSLDVKSARDLSRLVSKNNIQIVHAHMARDYPLAAYAVRRNPRSRLIVTRHVLFRLNRLHRITLSKAARVIAVSKAVASQLQTDNLVSAEKISVVLHGIDTGRFVRTKAEFNRRQFLDVWNLSEGSQLVGTVGELSPLKGQEEFVGAAAQVLRQFPKTYFIIAGIDHSERNTNQKRLERMIEELDLSNHVKVVGWLDDLPQLYSALDVFVSASHTESFGLAIAEAMASSAAVVATETEGARELITEDETGLLVPIGNVDALASKIVRLLANEDERIRLGTTAQQTAVAEFSLERMITETEKIYEAETRDN
jgi:glycosyltransferase involved in cell wall biosynthesis